MREPSDNDLFVELDGVGQFAYAAATYGDRIAIRREYLRLLGDAVKFERDEKGNVTEIVDAELAGVAIIIARHRVLCTIAPSGWEDLAKVSEIDFPDVEAKMFKLWEGVRAAEERFRHGAHKAS